MIDRNKVILTLNVGSSSLKWAAFNLETGQEAIKKDKIELSPFLSKKEGMKTAIRGIVKTLNHGNLEIEAAGHRVVHGGDYQWPVYINEHVLKNLYALSDLAPLHEPFNIAGVTILKKELPDIPHIACFDTAFHRGHDPLVDHFALPKDYYSQGIKRYGFHGLSYEFISTAIQQSYPQLFHRKIVVAHLGNGSSLCAMKNGKSVDSTMGFSALDGLPMGTRCGSLDPGVILHMMRTMGYGIEKIEDILYRQSGLKGLSGRTHDVRKLLESDDPDSKLAIEYFCWRVAQGIVSMGVTMRGIDGLVFTGGIGENSEEIRQKVLHSIKWLNSDFDTHVIATNEELMIAHHTRAIIKTV